MAHHMNSNRMNHPRLCSLHHNYKLLHRCNRQLQIHHKLRRHLHLQGSCHRNHNRLLRRCTPPHPLLLARSCKPPRRGNPELQTHRKYRHRLYRQCSFHRNRILNLQRRKARVQLQALDPRSYTHLDSNNPPLRFRHRHSRHPHH